MRWLARQATRPVIAVKVFALRWRWYRKWLRRAQPRGWPPHQQRVFDPYYSWWFESRPAMLVHYEEPELPEVERLLRAIRRQRRMGYALAAIMLILAGIQLGLLLSR